MTPNPVDTNLKEQAILNRVYNDATNTIKTTSSIQETSPTDATKLNGQTVWTGLSSKGDDLTKQFIVDGVTYTKTFVYTGSVAPYTLTISVWS